MGCKVSIVIPVYNAEPFLGECLDSVLGQTLKDIEVLCVDDGSTDGSEAILAEYAAKDLRVRVLRQENAGPGPARNRALDVATGECVAFMDPDDLYPDDGAVESLYAALTSSGCAIAGGRARCFPEDTIEVARRNIRSDRICAFPHLGVVEYAEYQVPFRYTCYMFRRKLLDGIRFPDLRSFQDVPFFATAMAKAGSFFAIDRIVYAYRQHEGNGTKNLTPVKVRDRMKGIGLLMRIAMRNGYWRMFDVEARRVRKMAAKHGTGLVTLAWRIGLAAAFAMVWRGLRRKVRKVVGERFGRLWWRILKSRWTRRLVEAWCARRGIDGKKVVFVPFAGTCGCNPKYIARALVKMHPNLDIVWLLDPKEFRRLGGRVETGRAIPRRTLRAIAETASARLLVDNAQCLLLPGMPAKRDGQTWVNTWHGSLGIKRLDTASGSARDRAARMDGYDAVFVNSDFEEKVFRQSLFAGNALLRMGHARNDVFFMDENEKRQLRSRVKAELGVPESFRLALYAPTFRERGEGFVPFDIRPLSLDAWAAALHDRFGGRWMVAVRLHPRDVKYIVGGSISGPACVVDASRYGDMQELLVAAEAGITDYSSWIFDYILGGAPGFIFAPDFAGYDQSRGFCYPLSETPFAISETEEALCTSIRSFDAAKYASAVGEFLLARGCMEDGHASERIADFISETIGADGAEGGGQA